MRKEMFRIINIFEIFSDYYKTMRADFNIFPFITIFFGIPFIITIFLSCLVSNELFNEFIKNMIIINTILIPLLINVLMILYYSIERTKTIPNSKERITKIDYLKHLHLTLIMTILISTIVLIISVLLDVTTVNYQQYLSYYQFFSYQITDILPIKLVTFFLIGFLFLNIVIVIKRIYLLIDYEITIE
jgi:hypothetical protein